MLEEDFQNQLDSDPSDWFTRLKLADYLEDLGDERAEGYRMLGQLRKYPKFFNKYWRWNAMLSTLEEAVTPESWKKLLPKDSINHELPFCWWRLDLGLTWPTRKQAEDVVCVFFFRNKDDIRTRMGANNVGH